MKVVSTTGRSYAAFGTVHLNAKWHDRAVGDPVRQAKIRHEYVHLKRQGGWLGCTLWLARYFASKRFRCQEESLAFAVEIRHLLDSDFYITEQAYRNAMVNDYWGAFTPEDADRVIAAAKAVVPISGIDWTTLGV